MSVSVGGGYVLKWTSLNKSPVMTSRCHWQGWVGIFRGLMGISRGRGYVRGDCLPPCEQTDSCENITFQQLPLQLVKHSKECRTTAFATSKSYLGIWILVAKRERGRERDVMLIFEGKRTHFWHRIELFFKPLKKVTEPSWNQMEFWATFLALCIEDINAEAWKILHLWVHRSYLLAK